MKLLRILPVPFLLFSTAYGGLVQSVNPQVPIEYAVVKAQVVEMFEHGYQQYKWVFLPPFSDKHAQPTLRNYAWGYDNLAPLTKSMPPSVCGVVEC